jgi:hemin uptake protein HemP
VGFVQNESKNLNQSQQMREWLCVVMLDVENMTSKKVIIGVEKVLIVHDGADSIGNMNGRDLYCKER